MPKKNSICLLLFYLGLAISPFSLKGQEINPIKNLEEDISGELTRDNKNTTSFRYKLSDPRIHFFPSCEEFYEKSSLSFKMSPLYCFSWMDSQEANSKESFVIPHTLFPSPKNGSVLFQVPITDYLFSSPSKK